MELHFDIKSKIDELTKKIQENPDLAKDFQKDPIKTVESLIGIDLPDDKLQPVIAGVKSKLASTGLGKKLDELAGRYDCIVDRRGAGLMQGLVFDRPVGPVITKALDKGLILINAGTDIIRFVPPLIITKEHVDEMIQILEQCLS